MKFRNLLIILIFMLLYLEFNSLRAKLSNTQKTSKSSKIKQDYLYLNQIPFITILTWSKIISLLLFFVFFTIKDKDKDKNDKDHTNDPFHALDIEELNPKKLLEEIDSENKPKEKEIKELNSIQDLPQFLKNSKLSDEEIMEVLSRFLLQDDYNLKQYGAIYDKTGFDGIPGISDLPIYENERYLNRANSAASIYVRDIAYYILLNI